MSYKLEDFDYVQFAVGDINTVPKGRLVPQAFCGNVARNGVEVWNSVCLLGPNCESPDSLDFAFGDANNHIARPCLETLTPVPWVSEDGHRYGNVLCDLYFPDGTPNLSSPRQLLQDQVIKLRQRHGLKILSAFEYEFFVFKEGTLQPLGSIHPQYSLRFMEKNHKVFTDLHKTLKKMDIHLSSMQPECSPGQWEITTEPHLGVRAGDVGYYVKNAVKSFFPTRGYEATFMTKPTIGNHFNGLHLNHSLWEDLSLEEGEEGEEDVSPERLSRNACNAFLDERSGDKLSDLTRHWIAGVLTHAPALSAICCPTLNCYSRLSHSHTPSTITWGMDNREALIRVRTNGNNVFLENRLVSGAANPYLALAATIAAGMDGLDRHLTCPPPMTLTQDGQLPTSLDEAFDLLEKDEQLRVYLGDHFLHCYITAKRDYEVSVAKNAAALTEEDRIHFERQMYMEAL